MAPVASSVAPEPGTAAAASPASSSNTYANSVEGASSGSSRVATSRAAGSSVLGPRLASRNLCPPIISWLQESWLETVNRYERIATASPRLGVGVLGQELLQHHINLLPTLGGTRDFLPVYNGNGVYVGARAKMATWPLSKEEAMRTRTFAS